MLKGDWTHDGTRRVTIRGNTFVNHTGKPLCVLVERGPVRPLIQGNRFVNTYLHFNGSSLEPAVRSNTFRFDLNASTPAIRMTGAVRPLIRGNDIVFERPADGGERAGPAILVDLAEDGVAARGPAATIVSNTIKGPSAGISLVVDGALPFTGPAILADNFVNSKAQAP